MDAEKTPFTPKQERFCLEYMTDLNATQAAKRAGYSPRNAHRIASGLLKNPHIKARVQALQAGRAERVGLTQDWVIGKLRDVVERAMGGAPVLDKDGKPTGEWRFEGFMAIKALELIGKHLGMFLEAPDPEGRLPDKAAAHFRQLLALKDSNAPDPH